MDRREVLHNTIEGTPQEKPKSEEKGGHNCKIGRAYQRRESQKGKGRKGGSLIKDHQKTYREKPVAVKSENIGEVLPEEKGKHHEKTASQT